MTRIHTAKLILLLLLISNALLAQKQRNYIYLFDCTASMKSNRIWEPAKQWLRDDIARQDDDASFVIVPFRDKADACMRYESKKEVKCKDIEDTADKMISILPHKTGICNAWREGVKYLDPKKDNYFILITDGKDEYEGPGAVKNLMNSWCQQHPDDYGFWYPDR